MGIKLFKYFIITISMCGDWGREEGGIILYTNFVVKCV